MHARRGHLDPHKPQSNITFAQTIARDKPDIIGIQIGENDVMQQPSRGENVSCVLDVDTIRQNASELTPNNFPT